MRREGAEDVGGRVQGTIWLKEEREIRKKKIYVGIGENRKEKIKEKRGVGWAVLVGQGEKRERREVGWGVD